MFSTSLVSCGGKSETGQNDSIQKTAQTEFSFHFKENSFPGTYQFTDEKGVTCKIVLKDDNTFTAESSKSDNAKTGKWSIYNNDCPKLSFDDTDDLLFFTFPEGKEDGNIKQAINDAVITDDGYIYALSIYYDAKKQEKRLPIRKID